MDKPLVIFICGMPGTRKSSTAVLLAAKLGIKVVLGTDQIRDAIRPYTEFEDPFLYRPTHNCWELLGEKTPKNIALGYLRQSSLIKLGVMSALELAIKRGENMIFEGVHLSPSLYSELQNNPDIAFFHFLLWTDDEKLHSANIALKVGLRHGKENPWPEEKIMEIREIQKFLLSVSHLYPAVNAIKSTAPENNIGAILKILEQTI